MSTKSSYKTHLKSYSAFCSVLGVPLVPAEPHLISLYVVLLARSLQYKSIPQYLNIISLLHKSLDMPSPLDSFIVKSTLRGIRNTIGHEPTIKLPVTPEILYKILPYESRAEFCQIFVHFLGNWVSRKMLLRFTDL